MQRRSAGSSGAQRLAAIPLFEGVSPGELNMLGRILDVVVAEPGEVLMAEGGQGFEVMMIEEGSAEVLQRGERINVMEPGDFFGEIAVLSDGAPRTATVVALTPLQGLVFTAHFARTMHDRLPRVGERMQQAVRERRERDAGAGTPRD